MLDEDEAFAFRFITTDYDIDMEQIFGRMIDSLDICR